MPQPLKCSPAHRKLLRQLRRLALHMCRLPLAVRLQLPAALLCLIKLLPAPVQLPLQLGQLPLQVACLITCTLGVV